ncbi:MAG TPA: ABC transporter ATP-binding protein [Bacteroidales bacterium]|nr:ABC transporter ATP-binding protein [Bacteroidales bacterium]
MHSEIAIKVSNLSKKYSISGSSEPISLGEGLRNFFGKNKTDTKTIYALDNVSFEVRKGQVLGIIGRNGAGKSTLLKILSRVTVPSSGRIEINGSIASVLEIGMGFHPELSGRENVYLSGTMLGIDKRKIDERFNDIVEFAGVQKFINTPVKHYSSGMYLRLAFSVVTNIDADILLFDEVLSVGDLSFQMKCLQKIKSLHNEKKTIIIVSHNLNEIAAICQHVIFLEHGQLVEQGSHNLIKKYFEDSIQPSGNNDITGDRVPEKIDILEKDFSSESLQPGDQTIRIKKVYIVNESNKNDTDFFTNQSFRVCVEFEKFTDTDFFDISIIISNMQQFILSAQTITSNINIEEKTEKGDYIASVLFDEDFFNETILNIGYSVTRNNKDVVCYDTHLLRMKINLFIGNHQKQYYANIQKFLGPLRPKQQWIYERRK